MDIYDIAIVGAGPAGLSAALYAARFCRSTIVLHDGAARAGRIPLTQNAPGFPEGIAGDDLLERMTSHAEKFAAKIVQAHVLDVARVDCGFELSGEGGERWAARSLILATGVELNQIPLEEVKHEAAIAKGILRYCPVCDGFEHQGERISVLGGDVSGASEALFLAGYSDDVTLLAGKEVELTAGERRDLEDAGVKVITDSIVRFEPINDAMCIHLADHDESLLFDVLYPALGVRPRNRLAVCLSLKLNHAGTVDRGAPFSTDVPGLFCAGDLVDGLDQISVAMGHGAIAATRAHNWLRERDGKTAKAVLGRGTEHPPVR